MFPRAHLTSHSRMSGSRCDRRDITLSTKVHLVKAMVFPVVMYGCESWTIKKAECRVPKKSKEIKISKTRKPS